MEGLAVELFNNDPVVIEKLGENAFNRASWTKEVRAFFSVQEFTVKLVHGVRVLL